MDIRNKRESSDPWRAANIQSIQILTPPSVYVVDTLWGSLSGRLQLCFVSLFWKFFEKVRQNIAIFHPAAVAGGELWGELSCCRVTVHIFCRVECLLSEKYNVAM